MKFKIAAIAIFSVVVALLTAGSASASTPDCTTGFLSGYCGTQADNGTPVLVMDSKGQGISDNNPVIGWVNSSTDPGTDFFQLPYEGDNALGVMFDFTPSGYTAPDLCVSDPGNGKVVLRPCSGSNWQRWVASEVGTSGYYEWVNRATHRMLIATKLGAQLTTIAVQTVPGGNGEWKFTT